MGEGDGTASWEPDILRRVETTAVGSDILLIGDKLLAHIDRGMICSAANFRHIRELLCRSECLSVRLLLDLLLLAVVLGALAPGYLLLLVVKHFLLPVGLHGVRRLLQVLVELQLL